MSDTLRGRRRTTAPLDVTGFRPQVSDALTAFGSDASYAVAMARAAVVIANKRRVWQQRREQRDAA